MFTGIIENIGIVKAKTSNTITVSHGENIDDLKLGSSIAVDGACLTVAKLDKNQFTADVMPISFERTSLGERKIGDEVNLERAMEYGKRFEGHMVSGHVEGRAELINMKIVDNAYHLRFKTNPELIRYVVQTGSIAINGISLTVMYTEDNEFEVGIIPHTWDETNLHNLEIGKKVNIETDIMIKYTEKLNLNEFNSKKSQGGDCCDG